MNNAIIILGIVIAIDGLAIILSLKNVADEIKQLRRTILESIRGEK